MAMLGDLLASARKSTAMLQGHLAHSDPELAAKLSEAASSEGLTPSAYARMAVADFTRFASEEDWATLTSSMRDSAEPGTVCLVAMVHWRLTAPRCEAHSHASA